MKKIIVKDKWSIMIISFGEWPSLKKSFLGEQLVFKGFDDSDKEHKIIIFKAPPLSLKKS